MYKDLNTENIKLKQTIEIMKQEDMELVQTIEMQGQMIEKLNLSVAELKRRLVRHDNYNTPPSQKKGPGWPDTKKDEKKNGSDKSTKTRKGQKDRGEATGSPRPRGGQKGHEGRTRRPKPTEFKEHTPSACPECGSGHLSIITTEKRDITRKECTVKVHHHAPHHKHVPLPPLPERHRARDRPSRQGQLRLEHNCRSGRRLRVPHAV